MNLVTYLGKQILGVLACYQQDDIVIHICGVYPQWDNRLRVFFPRGHALQVGELVTCRIPSDHIPIRSWPLFLARELMRDLIETLKAEQST